ncbi:MAG: MFS transporter [Rhodospirillales bacterium]|nr:MFS transporter [Rhodospirillales bacterium]
MSTAQTILIILSGLVGHMLADDKALATLPISSVVVGTLMATVPASFLMKRKGRRVGFIAGSAFGLLGALIAASAIYSQSFWLFVFGTLVFGFNTGFAQYYRFAAADAVAANFRPRAISLVLTGGVIAAIVGPELAKATTDLMAPIPFLGAYVTIAAIPLIAAAILSFLDIPRLSAQEIADPGRPIREIARQPTFLVAVLCGMVGYAVMSLVMTATPLAMIGCGFQVADAAMVIQWHVLAMFAPSFVTGNIIQRFGVLQVILVGMVLLGICVIAALAGLDIENFWLAMVTLGLGWNFAFVGASTLLTETYQPSERAKVQATNDFFVFGSVALASLTSGVLLHFFGWDAVQYVAVPFLVTAAGSVVWLIAHRRRLAGAAT